MATISETDAAIMERLFGSRISATEADTLALSAIKGVDWIGDGDATPAVNALLASVTYAGLGESLAAGWSLETEGEVTTLNILGFGLAKAA